MRLRDDGEGGTIDISELANYMAAHPGTTIETIAQAARRKLEREAQRVRCDMPSGVEAAF